MSVSKMKDGKRWYVFVRYKDWTGQTRQHKKEGFDTRAAAKEYEAEFLAKKNGSPDMTVNALYSLYIEDCKSRLKPTTYAQKVFLFERHVLPHLGSLPADQVGPAQIRKWQNTLLSATTGENGKPYSQTYLKTVNNQASALFNFGVRYYGLKSNPCRLAGSMGKSRADAMQFWTVGEFNRFLAAISNKPNVVVAFSLLFWTGMRSGEMMALTPADFDFDAGTVSITKNLARLHGETIIMEPKTPKSRRVITMSPALAGMVKEYLNTLYGISADTRIFHWLDVQVIRLEMERGCKLSGVKRIRIHDLRHSHASLLIELGYSPLLIAERLGHENIETTLRTYSHLYPNKQSELAKKLGELEKRYDFATHKMS